MVRRVEFTRDSASPAHDKNIYTVAVEPVRPKEPLGLGRLVRQSNGPGLISWAAVVEAGFVQRPGVRGLRLWLAKVPGRYNLLTVDEAIAHTSGVAHQTFLASARRGGGLAVSAYLARQWHEQRVEVSGLPPEVSTPISLHAMPMTHRGIAALYDHHVARAQEEGFDPERPADPEQVDGVLLAALRALPQIKP